MEAAGISAGVALDHHDDDHGHHGPPPANRSSRVSHEVLGMLLFIISEIMVFGAFFTAYFFIRLVAEGHRWFPFDGYELPVAIAGMNTAILLSSSLTMHWAQLSIKNGNRFGLKAGMLLTSLLGADVPLHPDQRVRPHRLLAAEPRPGHDLLRPDRPARRARLHRPVAARLRHRAGVPRPLHARAPSRRRDPGHLLAFRRRHVGRRVHDDLHPLARARRAPALGVRGRRVLVAVAGRWRCAS